MKKFNVLIWDFNSDSLKYYDVLPYFRNCYKELKSNKPATLEEFKEFIKGKSAHMFWSRCEWEMICHGWPIRKNDYKLDVHEQVKMNIDIITEILYNEFRGNN